MAENCRGRVLTFGRSPGNDLWVDEIVAQWPSRLSFRAHVRSGSCLVRTNLVGEHWLTAVSGALLAAVACGVKLQDAASALEQVEPMTGRMQPMTLPNGVTFLRDEFNESLSTMNPALRVLADGVAERRLLIAGDVYDGPQKEIDRLQELGRSAARAAEVAVFLGRRMGPAARAAAEAAMKPEAVHAFSELDKAAEFLKSELRAGDLVLLRGCSRWHMERLYFLQLGTIRCRLKKCSIGFPCDRCEQLGSSVSAAQ